GQRRGGRGRGRRGAGDQSQHGGDERQGRGAGPHSPGAAAAGGPLPHRRGRRRRGAASAGGGAAAPRGAPGAGGRRVASPTRAPGAGGAESAKGGPSPRRASRRCGSGGAGRESIHRRPPPPSPRTMILRPLALACCAALPLAGCAYHLAEIQEPGRAVAFTTTGPWRSMIYAARTDSGVVVVDLGWAGAGGKLRGR